MNPFRRKKGRCPACPCCRTAAVEPAAPPDPDLGPVCGHCCYLLGVVEEVMRNVEGMGTCQAAGHDHGKGVAS